MSDNQGKTRREFLANAGKTAAAASIAGLAGCFPTVGGQWPEAGVLCESPDGGTTADPSQAVTSAVVDVFREDSLVTGSRTQVQPAVVADMLDVGLTALAKQVKLFTSGSSGQDGNADIIDGGYAEQDGGMENPWTVLLPNYKAGQTIGLKVNCLGTVATSPAFVRALIASLRDKLGVEPNKIIVWDRFLSDITIRGKYSADDLAGAQVRGNLLRGINTGESEDDPTITDGHGYGDAVTCGVPIGKPEMSDEQPSYPRLSRILTHETDLTINCLAFKDHNISGITGALKSVYGIINNPGQYHKPFEEVVASLYAIPDVRRSLSLTICDAIIGIMNGGPSGSSNCTPKRILLALDLVALDSYILDLMNQLRAEKGGEPILSPITWLDNAASMGLGTRNYTLIKV